MHGCGSFYSLGVLMEQNIEKNGFDYWGLWHLSDVVVGHRRGVYTLSVQITQLPGGTHRDSFDWIAKAISFKRVKI